MKKNIFIFLMFSFFIGACQSNRVFFTEFKELVKEVSSTKGIESHKIIYYRFNFDNIEWEKLILSQPYMPKEIFKHEHIDDNLSNEIFKDLFSTERNQAFLIQEGRIISHELLPTNIVIENGYMLLTPDDNAILLTYSNFSKKVLVQKLK